MIVGVIPFCHDHPDDEPDPSCAGCTGAAMVREDLAEHRERFDCDVWPLCNCVREADPTEAWIGDDRLDLPDRAPES